MELCPIIQINSTLTEIITRHAVTINDALETKIKELSNVIDEGVKKKYLEEK